MVLLNCATGAKGYLDYKIGSNAPVRVNDIDEYILYPASQVPVKKYKLVTYNPNGSVARTEFFNTIYNVLGFQDVAAPPSGYGTGITSIVAHGWVWFPPARAEICYVTGYNPECPDMYVNRLYPGWSRVAEYEPTRFQRPTITLEQDTFFESLSLYSSYTRTGSSATACLIRSLNPPFNRWVLTCLKNGSLVQQVRFTSQPTITTGCAQQCPPNTCDVLCGNTICCYNSEGVSVFNYPNT